MPKLFVIIGLPGSGKSHYLKEMVKKGIVNDVCVVYDDFHECANCNSSRVRDSRNFNNLIKNLKDGKNCAISDVAYCGKEQLDELTSTISSTINGVDIEKIYFENNPDNCKKNIFYDKSRSIEGRCSTVDKLTKDYMIPEGIKVIKVEEWHKENYKSKPWKEHAFSMATSYSILTAMVGVLLAVVITDKKITDYWYWPVGLLALSFVCFVWGVEKLSDALDEDDVDKYLTWFLVYNKGVILMFLGITTYILLHYHLGGWYMIGLLVFAILASWKWISDNWYLIFKNNAAYEEYRKELLGERKPEKDKDWLMKIHDYIRRCFHG